ncbi:HNH endonuclease signature motif containing protein [Pseudarthrobacter albicanus]|uniref:HNH endonuclease signature motif containing protein n=1 Tax=Pseudarthrobacter albicanus TaxID=2823873 RepID=UPI001BA5762E|nr:HNH endonuclease signature motif containing protein [Pseudarthrobacter albicanus]
MEGIREFVSFREAGQDTEPVLGRALGLLRTLASTAVEDAAGFGLTDASDFAGRVEELSRTVEYLQLVAAGAVDRTRKLPAATAFTGTTAWATGWRESPADSLAGSPGGAAGAAASVAASVAAGAGGSGNASGAGSSGAVDDGYRNTTEFLRARLRISAAEARRRLSLAGSVLPRPVLAGRQPMPALRAELGEAVAAGEVPSRSATIIALALDGVRHSCDAAAAAAMEHALTRTAAENDPDFLVRIARRWADALDQDGAEPSEELLRQLQGAFIRRTRHGLHHLEIFATADQFEQLLTVMNTATNPRTRPTGPASASSDGQEPGAAPAASTAAARGTAAVIPRAGGEDDNEPGAAGLDLRSRPQKLLDGLVGACKAALATGGLPAAGGLRPQVMVTIDYRDLLGRLADTAGTAAGSHTGGSQPGGSQTGRGPAPGHTGILNTGSLLFTGPVMAGTVRKIACDADIIPVLLGTEGRILDIGRTSRIFPPHIRKALTARDQGCAFPGCTIPAPWCEAHHISYWSRGGSTGTDNGTILCSHHHHALVHKEQWTIQLRTGIPWFIPPPHLDPRQEPRRNHYFRLE